MKLSRSLAIIPFLLPAFLPAQELLTPEEALRIARDSSYAVRLAANEAAIARNNNTAGNAGFLPRVDVTAGAGGTLSNAQQQRFSTGEIVDRTGAGSTSLNTGVGVSWTVFDGFQMFNQRDQLRTRSELGEIAVDVTEEGIAAQTLRAYYDVVLQQRILDVLRQGVAVSQARVENVQLKYEVGENSKRELLQAKVDLNADRAAILRQEVTLSNAKAALNQFLARRPELEFDVIDSIIVAENLAYDELRAEALQRNINLRAARVNQSLARLERKEVDAARFPTVSLNLGYNLSQANNDAGQIASNRNAGLNYGLSASMNLFNGFNTSRLEENAEIGILSSDLDYAEAAQQVETELFKAYRNYRNRLDLVKLERDNVTLAKENLDIALERSRFGAIIPLELREAQNAYIAAESRLLAAQYDAKLAETELLRLSGRMQEP